MAEALAGKIVTFTIYRFSILYYGFWIWDFIDSCYDAVESLQPLREGLEHLAVVGEAGIEAKAVTARLECLGGDGYACFRECGPVF